MVTYIQPRYIFARSDWCGCFGSSQIAAVMPTPSCLSRFDRFMKPWCSTPFGSEATQAKGWLRVPTMILCETRCLLAFLGYPRGHRIDPGDAVRNCSTWSA